MILVFSTKKHIACILATSLPPSRYSLNIMKISVYSESANTAFEVDVEENITLSNLKSEIGVFSEVAMENFELVHEGRVLSDDSTLLTDVPIANGDLITMRLKFRNAFAAEETRSVASSSENTNDTRFSNPALHAAVERQEQSAEKNRRALKSFTPNSVPVVRKDLALSESLRLRRIDENLQLALDIAPESFIGIHMLYVRININGFATVALVDSGAARTIILPELATKFGIDELIDERFSIIASGVGEVKSKGKIHNVGVSLGKMEVEIPCSFDVLEVRVGILFGLDMLRRHNATIDLSQNALIIGDHNIAFLSENEIASISSEKDKEAVPQSNDQTGSSSGNVSFATTAEDVTKLMALGFTRSDATDALEKAMGNVDIAASLLFQ